MSKNQYTVFFYNMGYEKHGFKSVSAALDYIKDSCFEACVQNENREVVASWTPIGGTKYVRE